ncbi:MAG: hypothetical protein ACOYOV_14030 [Bacteroidales bacterium]
MNMEERINQIFINFLMPLFNDVLNKEYNGIKNDAFEILIRDISEKILQPLANNLNPNNTIIGAITDKLVDEYLENID